MNRGEILPRPIRPDVLARVRAVGTPDPKARDRRARVIWDVIDAIIVRWAAVGCRRWTTRRSVDGVPVPEPHDGVHRWCRTNCTSPSGKALLGCSACGVLLPMTGGECLGADRDTRCSTALFLALEAGVRYAPGADGVPVPVESD